MASRSGRTGSNGNRSPEIDVRDLELPAQPEVVDIRAEYLGSEPFESMRVWVVVPDSTPEEKLEWPTVKPIEDEIRREFRDRDWDAVPLILFRTESEFRQQRGEDH